MANLPVLNDARVLVIDDEPDLRTLYELTLLREGYRVETAGSVQEARDQLKQQRFDAIITDMCACPTGQAPISWPSCAQSNALSAAS